MNPKSSARDILQAANKQWLVPGLGLAARHCPFVLQQKIAYKMLQVTFAEAIEDGDLDFLNGRYIAIDISDLKVQFLLTFDKNTLLLVNTEREPEVTIRGELKEFIHLAARNEDPDTLFFQRRLSIEGDTELGLTVKNLIDSIDFDELPRWLRQGVSAADHFRRTLLS